MVKPLLWQRNCPWQSWHSRCIYTQWISIVMYIYIHDSSCIMDIWNYEGHNMASLQSTALCRNAIQNVTFRSSYVILKTINATNSNMRCHWIHTFQVKHVQIANFSPFLTFSVSDVDTPMDFHLVRLATDRTWQMRNLTTFLKLFNLAKRWHGDVWKKDLKET